VAHRPLAAERGKVERNGEQDDEMTAQRHMAKEANDKWGQQHRH
jgi:hypothetical protein